MSGRTTIALHGFVYQMSDAEEASLAEEWIEENLADTSGFTERFPSATRVAGIFISEVQKL